MTHRINAISRLRTPPIRPHPYIFPICALGLGSADRWRPRRTTGARSASTWGRRTRAWPCGDWRHGRPEIIANDQGNRLTPSCVAFKGAEMVVGDAAVNQAALNSTNTIFGEKLHTKSCFVSFSLICVAVSSCRSVVVRLLTTYKFFYVVQINLMSETTYRILAYKQFDN
jgi:hypothetical protein